MTGKDSDGAVLFLDEGERAALIRAWRSYVEARSGYVDPGEHAAEVAADFAGDPTLSADSAAYDAAVAAEEVRFNASQVAAAESVANDWDLGETVARTGRVDLSDPRVLSVTSDIIDYTGWTIDDDFAQPPAEMRRVVAAVAAQRQAARNSAVDPSPASLSAVVTASQAVSARGAVHPSALSPVATTGRTSGRRGPEVGR